MSEREANYAMARSDQNVVDYRGNYMQDTFSQKILVDTVKGALTPERVNSDTPIHVTTTGFNGETLGASVRTVDRNLLATTLTAGDSHQECLRAFWNKFFEVLGAETDPSANLAVSVIVLDPNIDCECCSAKVNRQLNIDGYDGVFAIIITKADYDYIIKNLAIANTDAMAEFLARCAARTTSGLQDSIATLTRTSEYEAKSKDGEKYIASKTRQIPFKQSDASSNSHTHSVTNTVSSKINPASGTLRVIFDQIDDPENPDDSGDEYLDSVTGTHSVELTANHQGYSRALMELAFEPHKVLDINVNDLFGSLVRCFGLRGQIAVGSGKSGEGSKNRFDSARDDLQRFRTIYTDVTNYTSETVNRKMFQKVIHTLCVSDSDATNGTFNSNTGILLLESLQESGQTALLSTLLTRSPEYMPFVFYILRFEGSFRTEEVALDFASRAVKHCVDNNIRADRAIAWFNDERELHQERFDGYNLETIQNASPVEVFFKRLITIARSNYEAADHDGAGRQFAMYEIMPRILSNFLETIQDYGESKFTEGFELSNFPIQGFLEVGIELEVHGTDISCVAGSDFFIRGNAQRYCFLGWAHEEFGSIFDPRFKAVLSILENDELKLSTTQEVAVFKILKENFICMRDMSGTGIAMYTREIVELVQLQTAHAQPELQAIEIPQAEVQRITKDVFMNCCTVHYFMPWAATKGREPQTIGEKFSRWWHDRISHLFSSKRDLPISRELQTKLFDTQTTELTHKKRLLKAIMVNENLSDMMVDRMCQCVIKYDKDISGDVNIDSIFDALLSVVGGITDETDAELLIRFMNEKITNTSNIAGIAENIKITFAVQYAIRDLNNFTNYVLSGLIRDGIQSTIDSTHTETIKYELPVENLNTIFCALGQSDISEAKSIIMDFFRFVSTKFDNVDEQMPAMLEFNKIIELLANEGTININQLWATVNELRQNLNLGIDPQEGKAVVSVVAEEEAGVEQGKGEPTSDEQIPGEQISDGDELFE